MISLARIAELAGALGTVEGLAHLNAEIESLTDHLMDPTETFSRAELAQTLHALDSLSAAIFAMDRVVREMIARSGAGSVDCVG